MGLIKNISKKRTQAQRAYKGEALKVAKKIASILAKKFGAKEVILFGSLVRDDFFDVASDIDLVVKGLDKNFLKAYGYCLRLSGFDLDITDYDELPERFKEVADREGRVLYG